MTHVPSRGVTGRVPGILAAAAVACAVVLGGADANPPWRPLFDGKDLGDWKPTPFGGAGEVTVVDGAVRIATGATLSGITWGGDVRRDGYEIALEARRVEGSDFFCGLTFPVNDDSCSLILGGWGGGVVGLSCIDGADAAENPTTGVRQFTRGRWYEVVVRVSPERIVCLLDGEAIIDQPRAGHRISIRHEVGPSQPLGIATYATTGEVRNIRWRPLPP